MRIMWVAKAVATSAAGDAIFDSKMVAAAKALGHSIDLFHPRRVGRLMELTNLFAGIPHPRTRYASAENLTKLRAASAGYDMVISSAEVFDRLMLQLGVPVIVVLHNITSSSLTASFPGSLAVTLLAKRVRLWEQRHYRQGGNLRGIGVLSKRDQAYVQSLGAAPEVLYLPPGMPPVTDLNPDAILLQELTILGTFDWLPKKRDVTRFAQEYAAAKARLTVRADRLPPEADELLKPLPAPTRMEAAHALRFGVITDRFESGHKLKTLAYIAGNNIVMSFSDVSFDFDHIPDHDLFIRRVNSFDEMLAHINEISAMPWEILQQRFIVFKQRCAECFVWTTVASRLMEAAARAA
jgi:hypothetical protein